VRARVANMHLWREFVGRQTSGARCVEAAAAGVGICTILTGIGNGLDDRRRLPTIGALGSG
jgi:hypothetical protein